MAFSHESKKKCWKPQADNFHGIRKAPAHEMKKFETALKEKEKGQGQGQGQGQYMKEDINTGQILLYTNSQLFAYAGSIFHFRKKTRMSWGLGQRYPNHTTFSSQGRCKERFSNHYRLHLRGAEERESEHILFHAQQQLFHDQIGNDDDVAHLDTAVQLVGRTNLTD